MGDIRGERGTMLPALGGLLFVGLIVLALCVDVAALHATYVRVSTVADAAAEAGASMIDVSALHEGTISLDQGTAASVASDWVTGAGLQARAIEVGAERVCVESMEDHHTIALGIIGLRRVEVVVRACAEPAVG